MNRSSRFKARSQHGVALLEVLVSILIFTFGVLGLIGLQARAITYSIEAEDRNRASLLANEIASTMWLSNNSVIDTSAGTPSWDQRVKDVLGPSAVVVVAPEATVPNSANITLTWSPPQRSSTESASSQLTTRVTLAPPP